MNETAMGGVLEAVLEPNHSDFLGRNEDLRRVADAIRTGENERKREEQKTSSASSPLVLQATIICVWVVEVI